MHPTLCIYNLFINHFYLIVFTALFFFLIDTYKQPKEIKAIFPKYIIPDSIPPVKSATIPLNVTIDNVNFLFIIYKPPFKINISILIIAQKLTNKLLFLIID